MGAKMMTWAKTLDVITSMKDLDFFHFQILTVFCTVQQVHFLRCKTHASPSNNFLNVFFLLMLTFFLI